MRHCVPAFPRFSPALPSPQKPALNPALRVWPGKAQTSFPPKGRTNPSPSLERRRDARDSPKENKGKPARRVDVQNTMKPQVTTLIQPQPRCRGSSKRRNPTLQRPLERFSFDFSTPAQTTGRRGVSASRMLSFFLGVRMGEDPLGPSWSSDASLSARAPRARRHTGLLPIRDWPQMRCAMVSAKKPGEPVKRNERARSFQPKNRVAPTSAPVTPEPFLFLRQWSSVFPLCRRSRDPSGKFDRCLSRHPPTMRPKANSPPRANPWPRLRPL